MSIIFVLIPLAIIIVSIAIGVFFWAVKSNQFDDLERQGYSILFDDDIKKSDVDVAVKAEPEQGQASSGADIAAKPQKQNTLKSTESND
ncbi:cbb3-type cytochrome oxidase assembly protein CcoS [Glaciecola sp. SC05]|uniref:cbb3-type cytochrome oxidase assembly protein CcoS n=1 Tax=Glaciecola sp. SC05 TaxID=1987355 RepID=UPI003528458A